MLYQRGEIWWFKFRFAGGVFRESAKTSSKTLARRAERKRHESLEEAVHGIKKRLAPVLFAAAAAEWLIFKQPGLAEKSLRIERTNLEKHLRPVFGGMLLLDITPSDIAAYQRARLAEQAAPKTINLEIGTLRAMLRRHRLWADLQPDVKMLPADTEVGRALTAEEERILTEQCSKSRSRALLPSVLLALHTGMRRGEIQSLRWGQIDFLGARLTVGHSKTAAGRGRGIPLNASALAVLTTWATNFPRRTPEHWVFAAERYGVSGGRHPASTYAIDPTRPLKSLKTAWASAKDAAGVACRFHDLRHTACTRLIERGVPLPVIASVLGWSAATTVRMARRYGHISADAQQRAMATLSPSTSAEGVDYSGVGTKLGTVAGR